MDQLAQAGRTSIVSTTRDHFAALKNTGVGLFYGWKSSYSPARPMKNGAQPVLWTDAQRFIHIKNKLKPSFKKTFSDEAQLDNWVANAVGVQESKPRSGSIQMTSCILWVIRHLEAAYKASGKEARWKQIRETLLKAQDRGIVLMDELQKDGWEAVYWNPDTRNPDMKGEKILWHTQSAKQAKSVKGYYPTWYSSKNPPKANEYIKVDHMMVNYRLTTADGNITNTKATEALKRVPFWVGIANFGEHSFVGYYDNISESHSPFMPEKSANVELSKFLPWGKAWSENYGGDVYLSGIIMVPPGTWNE